MAYKFTCAECGHELVVKWLKPGETAKCRKCGAGVKVPANAAEVENDDLPGPEPARLEKEEPDTCGNCPTCRFVEKINTAEFEGALPIGTFGACHRYPPGVEGRYPFLTSADWCGEYERNE